MIVLFIKGKLFQTENFLPLFVALKEHLKKELLIIYPSKRDLSLIKKNEDIYFSLIKVAKVKHFYATYDFDKSLEVGSRSSFWFYALGLISVLHRNLILFFLLYKSALLFSTEKIPFINWIINFNKYFLNGKFISLLIYPYNFNSFKNQIQREKNSKHQYITFKNLLNLDSNILISSYKSSDLKKISRPLEKKFKIFNVGYHQYFWPSWIKVLERSAYEDINYLKNTKYIFFPLAIIKRVSDTSAGIVSMDLSSTIYFILDAIYNINKNIKIIIRPHPSTEMHELKEILKKTKNKNIKIMFTNSFFLIQYCQFIVKYGLSMMDPKAIFFNKVCLRFHPKELIQALGPELSNKKEMILQNIYDVVKEEELKILLMKASKNQIYINKTKIKKPKENLILKEFTSYIQ